MFKQTILAALFVTFVLCAFAQGQEKGANWAVLVAGSNGYYNYRHQSDICHAYQTLKKNGLPDSNIIVFMYDDIANNAANPVKGSIVNVPGGPNVYPGVPKDYVGKDVTPQNFLNVLAGKDMKGVGSGKTLKSTANDRVFVYFSDHGAPGLVAFPGFVMLYAKDLIATLEGMNKNNQYSELVFYIEACESGSMFNKILSDKLKIYATTASNPFESSYACNYDNTYRAYLNDCYSVAFLNTTDNNPLTVSLQDQFAAIKTQTTQSHVCQYGDLSIAKEPVGNYLSNSFKSKNQFAASVNSNAVSNEEFLKSRGAVSSRDVKEVFLLKMMEGADAFERPVWQAEYELYKRQQARVDTIFGAIDSYFNLYRVRDTRDAMNAANDDHCSSQDALDLDCMKDATIAFEKECGKFDEYSIRYATYLRDACDAKVNVNSLQKQFNQICSSVVSF